MNTSAKEWLDFANIDLRAAEQLLKDESLTNVVCFHAQQCVEKSFKALIESNGDIPPKSHDLIRLYGIIENQIQLEEDILLFARDTHLHIRNLIFSNG